MVSIQKSLKLSQRLKRRIKQLHFKYSSKKNNSKMEYKIEPDPEDSTSKVIKVIEDGVEKYVVPTLVFSASETVTLTNIMNEIARDIRKKEIERIANLPFYKRIFTRKVKGNSE